MYFLAKHASFNHSYLNLDRSNRSFCEHRVFFYVDTFYYDITFPSTQFIADIFLIVVYTYGAQTMSLKQLTRSGYYPNETLHTQIHAMCTYIVDLKAFISAHRFYDSPTTCECYHYNVGGCGLLMWVT